MHIITSSSTVGIQSLYSQTLELAINQIFIRFIAICICKKRKFRNHFRSCTCSSACTSHFPAACSADVFLASERSVLLREMCGRHLGFLRERNVGERKKFLPRGWSIGHHPTSSNPKSNMAARWMIARF